MLLLSKLKFKLKKKKPLQSSTKYYQKIKKDCQKWLTKGIKMFLRKKKKKVAKWLCVK